jgi:hypothetical protein
MRIFKDTTVVILLIGPTLCFDLTDFGMTLRVTIPACTLNVSNKISNEKK